VRRVIVPVALVAALAVAGCGGSKGGGATTATTAASPQAALAAGKQIFTTVGCSSCHTLKDADASGHVGPNLDTLKPSMARVVKQVTNGGGSMPAFKAQLSGKQIQQVATYVSSVAGK
jgi:mono/diheme cytochrome c family protein